MEVVALQQCLQASENDKLRTSRRLAVAEEESRTAVIRGDDLEIEVRELFCFLAVYPRDHYFGR